MFEWDSKKAAQNKTKHGITFEQASGVFFDSVALDGPDLEHSHSEPRFIRLGKILDGIIIVSVYTVRRNSDGSEKIRIISARKANKKERQTYNG